MTTVTPGYGSVALSDDSVLYGASATTPSGYGLYAIPKSGGAPVLLADAHVGALAVNATTVVFGDATNGQMLVAPKTGGTPTTLQNPAGSLAALDDESAYIVEVPSTPPSAVYRVPLNGGAAATKLLDGPYYVRAIAVRDHVLYVSSYDPNAATVSIAALPASGGKATVVASSPAAATAGLLGIEGWLLSIDATTLYTDAADIIVTIPRAGGAPTATAALGRAQGIHALAVDEAAIYWGADAEVAGGYLMRVCK